MTTSDLFPEKFSNNKRLINLAKTAEKVVFVVRDSLWWSEGVCASLKGGHWHLRLGKMYLSFACFSLKYTSTAGSMMNAVAVDWLRARKKDNFIVRCLLRFENSSSVYIVIPMSLNIHIATSTIIKQRNSA